MPSAQALAVTVLVSQALREENPGEETLQSCLEELLKLGPKDFIEVMELLKPESFKSSLCAGFELLALARLFKGPAIQLEKGFEGGLGTVGVGTRGRYNA